MKKLFAILAAALFIVACGGGNTKNEPKSIEEQLLEYMAKIEEAAKARDLEKGLEIKADYFRWIEKIKAEQHEEEFSEALEKHMESIQMTMSLFDEDGAGFRYGPDYDCEEDCEDEVAMVYSNMYDGYLNVRAEPSSKSKVVGTLRNGPEGAELLGVEGKWTKVNVNGVVGYIWSADTQSYPSDPVYIDASAVVGEWAWCDENAHFDSCTIESKGDFYMTGYLSMEASGKWHLSGHNIILKYDNGEEIVCGVKDRTLIINGYEYSACEQLKARTAFAIQYNIKGLQA